jgi:hypothetical protein
MVEIWHFSGEHLGTFAKRKRKWQKLLQINRKMAGNGPFRTKNGRRYLAKNGTFETKSRLSPSQPVLAAEGTRGEQKRGTWTGLGPRASVQERIKVAKLLGVGPYFANFFAKFHPFSGNENFAKFRPFWGGLAKFRRNFQNFANLGRNFVKIPQNLGEICPCRSLAEKKLAIFRHTPPKREI